MTSINKRESMKPLFVLATAVIVLGFSSCKHTGNESPGHPVTSLNDFFSANKPAAESFVIDASQSHALTTQTGMTIYIGANAFLDQNGPVTSGNIEIKVTH